MVTFANAAAGGDKYVWDRDVAILCRNDDSSAKTVTVNAATTVITDPNYGELDRSNIALVVPNAAIGFIPPPPIPFRNLADSSKVSLTYSAVTNFKIAAVRLRT